ncbi:hypothetical protein HDU97_009358 [Phlyctochytrium planicorne]|nr:hypothetical protein HDU97_009358 [Phlyctochytrium planicorne]
MPNLNQMAYSPVQRHLEWRGDEEVKRRSVGSKPIIVPELGCSRKRSHSDPSGPSAKGKLRPDSSAGSLERRRSVKARVTADQTKENRVRMFFRHGVLRHDEKVFQNRGLDFSNMSNGKFNLGIMLHITEKYNPDLDIDRDQSVIPLPTQPIPLAHADRQIFLQTIQGESQARASLSSLEAFREAESLIKTQFAEKNVCADLGGVLDDDFTVDMARDVRSCEVLGAVEYVFMKRYLWVDAVAVESACRGMGVGVVLMNRLKAIAEARQKQILCFALHDVVGWYLHQGFVHAEETFPRLPWHIGLFLVYTPESVKNDARFGLQAGQTQQQMVLPSLVPAWSAMTDSSVM